MSEGGKKKKGYFIIRAISIQWPIIVVDDVLELQATASVLSIITGFMVTAMAAVLDMTF